MRICLKCGTHNDDTARYCSECGEPLQGYVCPKCHKTSSKGATFCPFCGHDLRVPYKVTQEATTAKVQSRATPQQSIDPHSRNSHIKRKSFKNPTIIIAIIVGLYVLMIMAKGFSVSSEKNRQEPEVSKVAEETTLGMVQNETESLAVTESQGISVIEASALEQEQEEHNTHIETSPLPEETIPATSWQAQLLADLASILEPEVAGEAYDIIVNQVGIKNAKYAGQPTEGITNYEIDAEGLRMLLTASDEVYALFIPNGGPVFYRDGEVKTTYQEYIKLLESTEIDSHDFDTYYIIATGIVKDSLKNPQSAKFPSSIINRDKIAMQRKDDIIAVSSYVDATNSFNATVRSKWIVQFEIIDKDQFSYNLIYLNIDGEKYGDFINMD